MNSSQVKVLPAKCDEGREGRDLSLLTEVTGVAAVEITMGSLKSLSLLFLGAWLDNISQIPMPQVVTVTLVLANGMKQKF